MDLPKPGATGRPGRGRLLFEALCLVVFQGALLYGFRGALDLNLWDEYFYCLRGSELLAGGLGELDYSWSWPLTAIYALVQLLPDFGAPAPDLVFPALTIAGSLAIWWALRPCLPGAAALCVAAWWGASGQALALHQTSLPTSTYTLGLALAALALGLIVRGRLWLALLPMALAILNRGEYALWTAVFGLVLAGLAWRRSAATLLRPGLAHAALGGLGVAANLVGWRARNHMWFAFRQHFGIGTVRRAASAEGTGTPTAAELVDGFRYPDAHVDAAFGQATSVGEALRNNPREFLAHIRYNLEDFPGIFWRALTDSFAYLGPLRLALLAGIALGCVAGLTARRAREPAQRTGLPGPAKIFACSSVVILGTALLLRPRAELLLPCLLAVLALATPLCARGWRRLLGPLPGSSRAAALAPLLLPLAALLLPQPYDGRAAALPYRDGLRLIEEHLPDEAVGFLAIEASGLLFFAGKSRPVPIDPSLPEFLAEWGQRPHAELQRVLAPAWALGMPALDRVGSKYPGLLSELENWEVVASGVAARLLRR